jgi:phosphatidylserine decarboxylase
VNKKKIIIISIIVLALLLISFLAFWKFWFLRDPEIQIPQDPSAIVSPASGRVLKILEIENLDSLEIEKGLIGKINTTISEICDSCYIVSIFMSPMDVHIQRASLSGEVISVEHKPGKWQPSTSFEKGLFNEKTETIVYNEQIGNFKIIQIAGFIVTRIENWVSPSQILEKGERIGLINLGSQVSIVLPKENIEILVEERQKVDSGSTIIARIIQ